MKSRETDRVISAIAVRQHGLVTREQLIKAGVSPETVRWRVRANRLQPVHRGVYRVGLLDVPGTRERAAVLACGAGAVISHRSAGGLLDISPAPLRRDPVDVTVGARDRGRRPGIRAHRVRDLLPSDVTEFDGIPTTTIHRTLFDLAGETSPDALRQIFARAVRVSVEPVVQGLEARARSADTFRSALLELIERHPRRRGVPLVRTLLAEGMTPALTRSEAEERVLRLIAKGRLPRPEVNAWIEGCEVDFLWQSHRVVLEVDGYAFHSTRETFESDRSRDARLLAGGYRVMRVTWRQITAEREATLVRIAQTLATARTF